MANLPSPQVEQERLDNLAVKSSRVLFTMKSIFPFQLFPDSLIIDESKVTLVKNHFFATRTVYPLFIDDLTLVQLNTSILFASLRFELRGYDTNPPPIEYLNVKEATKARRIITGLAAIRKEKIEVGQLSIVDVVQKLEQIGKSYEDYKGVLNYL